MILGDGKCSNALATISDYTFYYPICVVRKCSTKLNWNYALMIWFFLLYYSKIDFLRWVKWCIDGKIWSNDVWHYESIRTLFDGPGIHAWKKRNIDHSYHQHHTWITNCVCLSIFPDILTLPSSFFFFQLRLPTSIQLIHTDYRFEAEMCPHHIMDRPQNNTKWTESQRNLLLFLFSLIKEKIRV